MAWIIQGDQLVNTDSIAAPGTPFVGNSPYTFWRIDPNANGGMPYVPMMIGLPVLNLTPPIVVHYGSIDVTGVYFCEHTVKAVYFGEKAI